MATTNSNPDLTFQTVMTPSGSILINARGEQVLLDSAPGNEQAGDGGLPPDNAWVKQSFITYQTPQDVGRSGVLLAPQDRYNRSFTTAVLKYTDSSPGGNKMINPPAQFTRYADIRSPRLMGDTPEVGIAAPANHQTLGQGRYYSEAVDDNSQIIHMRFGVATFNSLTQFFTGFYSSGMASMARGARYSDDFITKWTTLAGNVIGLAIAPLFIIPIAILMLGTAARFFMNWPSSKFYYLKPAMPLYWLAVSNLFNQMSVNSGLSTFTDTAMSTKVIQGGDGVGDLTATNVMNMVGHFLPTNLIGENGTIDIYAVANRSNRLEMEYQKRMGDAFKNAPKDASWFDVVRTAVAKNPLGNFRAEHTNLETYFWRFLNTKSFNAAEKGNESFEKDLKNSGYSEDRSVFDGAKSFLKETSEYFVSNLNDGSEFVSYRVDYTGTASEHFDNSVAESSLASKINGMSRSNRETRFSFADGNVGGGLGTIMEGVRGLMSGIAEVVQVDGLAALAGSAFVDIPKHWNESSTTLNKSSYNITLTSPYGNPISRLFNIWMPLATLLAGALPLATGKQSHTSPFLVELHDRGRCMTRLGIIDSMTITRGTSNLGFDRDGNAMAIDVTFSVLDLSGVMALPIQQGFSIFSPLEGLFDGDNSFTDYLMTLAALKLSDTIYRIPLLKYQINRKAASMNTFFSAAHIGSFVASLPGMDLIGAAMKGTDRQ